MRLYLAGPSCELPRIVAIRDALTNVGHVVTSRWIDIVQQEHAGGKTDADVSEARLIECAEINLHDLAEAEMMVYVVEHNGRKSVGAGVELGYQLRMCRDRIVVLQEPYDVYLRSAEIRSMLPQPTLFALLCHRVDSMDKLLAYLEGWDTSARAYEALPSGEWP
jgi:hypothetical protein